MMRDEAYRRADRSSLFDEAGYLSLHADVAAAVADGRFASGFDHWLRRGRARRRPGSGISPYLARRPAPPRSVGTSVRVLFSGPISAPSGLGAAARGYVRALRSTDLALTVHDATGVLYPDHPLTEPAFADADVVILHVNAAAMPAYFARQPLALLDSRRVIGIWVWEQAAFDPRWIEHFAAVDEIWTPSRFSADAIRALAPASTPVHVVPHVVETGSARRPAPAPRRGEPFTFLTSFEASSSIARKNPLGVLAAFKEAFAGDPDARLTLKCHDRGGMVVPLELRDAVNEVPGASLIVGYQDAPEHRALVEAVDCHVSAHRAEGFGLNVAEAIVAGIPVIATRYGGTTDFACDELATSIPAGLTMLAESAGDYRAKSVWGEPDPAALRDAMLSIRSQGAEVGRQADEAREAVAAALSARSVGALMRKHLVDEATDGERGWRANEELGRRKLHVWRAPEGGSAHAAACGLVVRASRSNAVKTIATAERMSARFAGRLGLVIIGASSCDELVARALRGRGSGIRFLDEGADVPPDEVLWRLAEAAPHDWLVFGDADPRDATAHMDRVLRWCGSASEAATAGLASAAQAADARHEREPLDRRIDALLSRPAAHEAASDRPESSRAWLGCIRRRDLVDAARMAADGRRIMHDALRRRIRAGCETIP